MTTAYSNRSNARLLYFRRKAGIVAWGFVSNSNLLKDGHGLDHGFRLALDCRDGLVGSGVFGGVNNGMGSTVKYSFYQLGSSAFTDSVAGPSQLTDKYAGRPIQPITAITNIGGGQMKIFSKIGRTNYLDGNFNVVISGTGSALDGNTYNPLSYGGATTADYFTITANVPTIASCPPGALATGYSGIPYGWRPYYAHLANGATDINGASSSILVAAASGSRYKFNKEELSVRLRLATFNSGSGKCKPCARLASSPFTVFYRASQFNTNTGTNGLANLDLSIPADNARTLGVEVMLGEPGVDVIKGPFGIGSVQAWLPGRAIGSTCTNIIGAGGRCWTETSAFMGEYVTLAQIAEVLDRMADPARAAGQEPLIILVLREGLNQRNYTALGSYPNGITPGNSAAAAFDSLCYQADRFLAAASLVGLRNNILFIPMRDHRLYLTDPDDTQLVDYQENAIVPFCRKYAQSLQIDTAASHRTIPVTDYLGGAAGDPHMVQRGYEAEAEANLAMIDDLGAYSQVSTYLRNRSQ